MENKKILDVGSLLSDFNQGAASKFGKFVQEKLAYQDKKETVAVQTAEYEGKEPVGDFDVTYKELCNILDSIKKKWGKHDTDSILFNSNYQRDLLYLYDRISLEMNYLNEYPEINNEWLDKLQELKYEIRNML